jgi:primosomal protein N' (replication factor Y) (superfamily II helicase)
LIIRVVPDVAGLDGKSFDYLVSDELRDQVRVGGIVRVSLHGRRVRAWVTAVDIAPAEGVALKPIARVSRGGTSAELVDLADWASWRWAGRVVHVLDAATNAEGSIRSGERRAEPGVTVIRVPPAAPRPTFDGALVVDGRRSTVWASAPEAKAIVVVDEHDEGLQEERAPTWHARDVAVERARRAGIACVLLSPCPSLEALAVADRVIEPSRDEERAGWPILDVVDRRRDDPRSGLYSDRLLQAIRRSGARRVVCVLNRKGRSRLLACAVCGQIATCERCDAAVVQPESVLRCERCATERPVLCTACGATRLRNLRVGVGRVRDELEAILGEPVGDEDGRERVLVGTEAVLHRRVPDLAVVAFLDFDQELLSPRYRAHEQAMGLLARGARMLGPRARGGRLVAQTRHPKHQVLDAVLHADPGRLAAPERARRIELGFPPATALAAVSGAGAPEFIDAFGSRLGIDVLGPVDGRWLLRAPDHQTLCDALAVTPRPRARTRIEVDPLRI